MFKAGTKKYGTGQGTCCTQIVSASYSFGYLGSNLWYICCLLVCMVYARVSDLDLEQDEILKLASLGNVANIQ